MDNFDKISNLQYEQMQNEYLNTLKPDIDNYLGNLNRIISSLEINGFTMPLNLQNQLYLSLLEVKQILSTIYINKSLIYPRSTINNNPLILLLELNKISQQLNQHAIKSPFYLLLNKSNNLILNCVNKILNYFLKNNK